MPKLPADLRPRLTLEDYILFFTTRSGHGLTMDHLNQIIFMHGFIKFHRQNKPVIVDALNKFDLMRPRRSTVGINGAAPSAAAAHMPIAAIRPGSAAVERVSPRSILSACSPPPPTVVVNRKRCKKGQGKAAMRGKKRRVVQLLTLPSVENMAATA
uniref:DUF7787 domain-containing protein n=1 Tax=Oryza punctata TaxID=4537 RepID=A0A0E0KCU5_ORYPU